MSLPQDIQRLLQTVRGAREAEERIRVHKNAQALLLTPKLEEVRVWIEKMADELEVMIKENLSLFPNPFTISAPSISVTHHPGEFVTLHFLSNRIVFEPFLERSMIQCRPDSQRFGGVHIQADRVTEDWVRQTVIQQIVHIMKADMLESKG